MEFFNLPPGADLLPPDQIHIKSLRAEPWPEGRRVKILIELTPFQQKPTIDLTLSNLDGTGLAFASIIEPIMFKLVITMHLPPDSPPGRYQVSASLYYPDQPPVDTAETSFEIADQPSEE